ncbi:MAG: hypothetical protein ABIN94_04915 [Ferruginibacter sp.]
MKISIYIFVSLLLFSCSKSDDPAAIKLLRTEATDYNGIILSTEYVYDNMNRIVAIKQAENNAPANVSVTIDYKGNEAVLISFPNIEPSYKRTKEVHLSLTENGKMLKRIEYTHGVSINPAVLLPETFLYDTLTCAYDAAGFLTETSRSLYDSSGGDQANNAGSRLTSTTTYTIQAANVVSSDEHAIYRVTRRNAGIVTTTGGNSDYHHTFNYTKKYPNQTDFKNVAVLNEFLDYYELVMNVQQKNMPDQVVINTIERDLSNAVTFTLNTTVDIERAYNGEGLLSNINILTSNTQYRKILHFYGK